MLLSRLANDRSSIVGWLALSALVLCAAPHVAAQDTAAEASTAEKDAAREAYAQGKQLYTEGRYDEALAAFESSYRNVNSPNSRLMVARCLAQTGRVAEAYRAYSGTIAEAAGVEKYAASAEAAEAERAELEGKIARVQVQVSADAADGALTVQGLVVASDAWASPVIVDPGEVEVVLTSSAGEDRKRVMVDPGATASVSVGVAAVPEPEPISEPASVEPEGGPTPMAERAEAGLVIGPKVGFGLGTGPLGATYVLELELGYALPVADRALEIFVSGQYTAPETDDVESEPDPRLPGDGALSYELTQQELALSLGLLFRIDVSSDLVMPYFGAGARLYLLKTEVNGDSGGEAFGQNDETQSDLGLLLVGGVDIFVGPGAVLAELQFGWASVDGFVLRNTNVGQLNLAVGYRFVL